jgi:AcrR family transcriptional regulator
VRQRARAVYRHAILDAAEVVFTERGFAGARMADIAAAAELAIGTLYNYFANREEILRSLAELRGEELFARLEAVFDTPKPPRERLEALVHALFAFLEEHRAMFEIFVELGDSAGGPAQQSATHSTYCRVQELFVHALTEARDAGELRDDIPIDHQVAFLIGATSGVARTWIVFDGDASLSEHAPAVVELFLSGASSRPDGR